MEAEVLTNLAKMRDTVADFQNYISFLRSQAKDRNNCSIEM